MFKKLVYFIKLKVFYIQQIIQDIANINSEVSKIKEIIEDKIETGKQEIPHNHIQDLLYCSNYKITEKITLHIPTIKEILNYGELEYFRLVSILLSTSKDYMVQLDDIGKDYEEISDFELFAQCLFQSMHDMNTTILFPKLSLSDFELSINNLNGELVLYNEKEDIIIDKYIHSLICDKLREILYIEKDKTKAGNKAAKDFMIKRARAKQKRDANKPQKPILRPLIVPLVNCQEFKYDYDNVLDLTIYQLYSSVRAIQKRINFNQTMSGIYAGTISSSDINMKEINWLS